MVDIHGKEYQVNVDKIVGFPSDFEIVREDMDMGLTVSGGRVLLQLSPDEEWHCLSTEISEEDVENQGSIEEYFDSLWDFWLFGDGDCPWYDLSFRKNQKGQEWKLHEKCSYDFMRQSRGSSAAAG